MTVYAGASIEAFLKLDASPFRKGLDEANTATTKFKESMLEVGKSGDTLSVGVRQVSSAIQQLLTQMESLSVVDKQTITNMKELGLALEHISIATQRFGSDLRRGGDGLQALNEIMKVFEAGMSSAEIVIKATASQIDRLRGSSTSAKSQVSSMADSFTKAKESLLGLGQGIPSLNRIDTTSNKVKQSVAMMDAEFKRSKENLLALGQGVVAFNNIDARSNRVKAQMELMNLEFEKPKAFLEQMAWTGVESFNRIETSVKKTSVAEDKLATSTQKVSTSMEKQSTATDKAANSMRKATTQASGLGRALSSVRTMGTLVGSMLAYNFIHKLGQATNETINAKSEMNGYFEMLGYTTSQTQRFNKALDETVKKFPRLNKYSLGETISSIGVEFELTTAEMEKAMPVVSMITSEYLRAGRNANEASLAVKDILQGEFQRLSRETGVKGDQLKEAGWSGDKSDVMGLLEALDKVGHDRNWDTFVTKANSLNDAVLILQNRFGEWSADMVEVVQPTILSVFNNLMSFGQGVATGLGNMWKWLSGDSWGAIATKIGLVATSVYSLVTAFAMYRTGASLVELRNTSLTKTIYSMITGTKLEQMANMSVRDSIVAKLLGLKAEEVAEKGLVGTINANLVAKRLSTTATEENTLARGFNTASIQSQMVGITEETDATTLNNLAKQLNVTATGEQTGATIGFTGALWGMITGEGLAEGATLSLTGAIGALTGAFLASPVGWFALAILGLASAFYVLSGGLDDSWAKMKEFKETMKDTDSAQAKAYEWLDGVKKKVGENSEEFKKAKDSVEEYKHELQSAKYWYDEAEKTFEGGDLTRRTNTKDILKKYGFTKQEIDEYNEGLDSLSLGKDKYYKALQVYNKQFADEDSNFAKSLDESMKVMDEYHASKKDMKSMANDLSKNYQNLAEHSYIANTSDDWWEWMWNSAYAGLDQLWIDLDEAKIRFGKWWSEDVPKSIGDASKYLSDAWNGLDDWFTGGLGNIQEKFSQWLSDASGSIGDSWNYLVDAWDNNIKKPILDWWNGFISFDWLFGTPVSASDGSSSHPSFMEDISNILGFDVQSWITSFNTDPLGTLGISLPNIDIIGLIKSLIPLDGGSFDLGGWLSNTFNIDGIISYFTTNLPTIVSTVSTTVTNVSGLFESLRSAIWSRLSSIVSNVTNGFNTVKTNAVTHITQMKDSVKGVIDKMVGAWNTMKDAILNSAKAIQDGVKEKFDSVKNTIGGFYHKLTNPSEWFSGSGVQSYSSSPKPNTARRLFAPVTRTASHHGAGFNPYTQSKQVTLNELVSQLGGNKRVDLNSFLSLFADSGFGSWDFSKAHKDTIFNQGKTWKADSPSMNGITLGSGYKVSRFWDGTPSHFTWSEFMDTAVAIFSAIPYKFYMDSDWKGNWVNALLSGAVNCSDGADALIALASLFGFSGSKVHTNLKDGTGHFFAVINGRKMDTTHFQNSGSWSPLGGAGIPTRSASYRSGAGQVQGKTVNVTNDFSGATIYGVDDLDSRIKESTKEAIREEFNDPWTVAI